MALFSRVTPLSWCGTCLNYTKCTCVYSYTFLCVCVCDCVGVCVSSMRARVAYLGMDGGPWHWKPHVLCELLLVVPCRLPPLHLAVGSPGPVSPGELSLELVFLPVVVPHIVAHDTELGVRVPWELFKHIQEGHPMSLLHMPPQFYDVIHLYDHWEISHEVEGFFLAQGKVCSLPSGKYRVSICANHNGFRAIEHQFRSDTGHKHSVCVNESNILLVKTFLYQKHIQLLQIITLSMIILLINFRLETYIGVRVFCTNMFS